MFGRRAGLFSTLAAVMLLLGGCGNAGANLGGTMDGYNNGTLCAIKLAFHLFQSWV